MFAVPPGHTYNTSRDRYRLGVGILDSGLAAFPPEAVTAPMGGGTQIIKWQKLSDSWASHVAFIDADLGAEPEATADALAGRARQGLRQLRLVD